MGKKLRKSEEGILKNFQNLNFLFFFCSIKKVTKIQKEKMSFFLKKLFQFSSKNQEEQLPSIFPSEDSFCSQEFQKINAKNFVDEQILKYYKIIQYKF